MRIDSINIRCYLVACLFIVLFGCQGQKRASYIKNSLYRSDYLHMQGYITIRFYGNSFFINERDSMYYSKGIYKIKKGSNEITLKSFSGPEPRELSDRLVFVDYTDSVIYIRNEKELMFTGIRFTRVQN
jgi:hypothetical protein